MKEFLSSNNVDFEDLDVDNDPAAVTELDALGVPIPPSGVRILPITVIGGNRIVIGFDFPALRDALGITSEGPREFSASELLEKYRVLYEGAKRAVLQILVADISMSLDNVLAVAGAARDHLDVLIIGLLMSVGLMGAAATFIAKLLERHRWIAYIGLGIVVYVAVMMVWHGGSDVMKAIN
jgi:hypothetical protein